MYTRCPHCTTIFRITAEQLRLSRGDLPCVTCAQSFNVLDSLTDDVTTLVTAADVTDGPGNNTMSQNKILAGINPEESVGDIKKKGGEDQDQADNIDPNHGAAAEARQPDPDPDQADTDPAPGTGEDLHYEEPQDLEAEDLPPELHEQCSATEPQNEDEIPIILPWLEDGAADSTTRQQKKFRLSWHLTGLCMTLALLLAGQLMHYNRDSLAADAAYGDTMRAIYGLFNASLYPDWPLDAYKITGTKAVAGQANQGALNIRANLIVDSQHPIDRPLIRIVLLDRWSTPVASRVFVPDEYLRTYEAGNKLVEPGTIFPVEISVVDPGAEALSYVVDICLPRRKSGLECQLARNPFL
ncbi:MAG: DUF3426 domain-containing protein [Gammaproteobacteria bacterium]|nr:hypothetical protein [Chromatiales bacterium]MCP4926787.1 DUF3426 domain-containing protein [Gammaproteobacteria bacterium]